MPAGLLERHFSRRMLPLAAVAGLVVAVAPPLAYRLAAYKKLAAQAGTHAEGVAAGIKTIAVRQPFFWRYNAEKLFQATTAYRHQKDIGSLLITDCAGRAIFSLDRPGEQASVVGPKGKAVVNYRGRVLALVEVAMSAETEKKTFSLIGILSAACALTVGLLLFLFPTRVVRGQAGRLSEMMRRLQSAEETLTAANQNLASRVEEAVSNVRRLSERLVSVQEEERGRIARDLHDSVGQAITALHMELELAGGQMPEAPPGLRQAIKLCEETLNEIRRVVRDLHPPELESGNLAEVLRSYAERFEARTGIAVSYRCSGDVEAPGVIICLLRVLQEALTNVSRHAQAREVGVILTVADGWAIMEVADDGKGMAAGKAADGFGLTSIRERCTFLGGEMTLESQPGEGTRLSVKLPLQESGAKL